MSAHNEAITIHPCGSAHRFELFPDGRLQKLQTPSGGTQMGSIAWDGKVLVGTFDDSTQLVVRRYLREASCSRLNSEWGATKQMCVEYRLPYKGGEAVTIHVYEPSEIAQCWDSVDGRTMRQQQMAAQLSTSPW